MSNHYLCPHTHTHTHIHRWNVADYTYGASLHCGHGQGCGFIKGSCYKWVWLKSNDTEFQDTNVVPFCRREQDNTDGCVDQRRAVGVCSIKYYPARLPKQFRVCSRNFLYILY